MGQFHWDAESYLDLVHAEVADYERLQDEAAEASRPVEARNPRARDQHRRDRPPPRPSSGRPDRDRLQRVDARRRPAAARTSSSRSAPRRIESSLPAGPFDPVVAALVIHHLGGTDKAELFGRIHAVLRPTGRFVLADVVVPQRPEDAITPLSPDYDHPSTVAEQLRRLEAAGFSASLRWQHRDLAVMAADRRGG